MEVARRLAEAAGLSRTGKRIQATVNRTIDVASRSHSVRVQGDFLWPVSMIEPPVRDRSGLDPSARKLEFVCDEEIAAALCAVIAGGFSLEPAEAISEALGLLGCRRVSSDAQNRAQGVLESLCAVGRVERKGDFVVAGKGGSDNGAAG